MNPRMPARPQPADNEDIASYLERCALMNHVEFTELTGHRRTGRIWENPDPGLLRRLAQQFGLEHDRLRRATLRGAFPDASLHRSRTGRRHVDSPVRCPDCGPVTAIEARLNVVVLCPRCHALLADDRDPKPLTPPAGVRQVQEQALEQVLAVGSSKRAHDRVQRLERLMVAQESALWEHWPPLLPGESLQWRRRVVRFERQAIQPGVTVSRPPAVTATLLALCWNYSRDRQETTARVDILAMKSEPWRPTDMAVPAAPGVQEATAVLKEHAGRLGIGLEHLPTTFRLPGEPIVLPRHLRAVRTAQAVALATVLRRHRLATRVGPDHVATEQGHSISDHMRRIAVRMLADPDSLRLLAAHASRLEAEGLTDVERLRCELRHVVTVPHRTTAHLPTSAAAFADVGRLASTWMWLDATRGRLAGGPHPNISAYRVLDFDRALNPEGRLILRQWWQQRAEEVRDDVQTRRMDESARRAG